MWNGTGRGPHQLYANLVNGAWYGYGYDANGNMTSGNGRTYTWDAANRPTAITANGVTETYRYDGDGNRITRTRNGQTTVYFQGLWEDTLGVNQRKLYSFGGQVVAIRDGNGVTYPHGDHLGSVSVVTDAGGNLAPNGTQEFDPWGSVRAGGITSTSLNFTGQRRDDTGLLFYNARYYDPQVARFVSADTVVPGAGTLTMTPGDATERAVWAQRGGGPGDAQALNRYSYVENNPVKNTDPTGHCIGPVLIWCVIVVGEFVADVVVPAVVGSVVIAGAVGVGTELGRAHAAAEAQGELVPPVISDQKQKGHVLNTPEYKRRVEQGKPTGYFEDPNVADEAVQEAWEKGGNPDPSKVDTTRQYDFGDIIPGAYDANGNPASKVRVHKDSKGRIHGYPVP